MKSHATDCLSHAELGLAAILHLCVMRRRERRQHSEETPTGQAVPPVLPVVRVTVLAADQVEITVDDELLMSGPIDRASLGRVLGTIVTNRGVPVRVDLSEVDGRRFSDIITPVPRRSTFAPPEEVPPPLAAMTHASVPAVASTVSPWAPPRLHRIEAAGFIPGEDVAVAIIVRSSSADLQGTAHALVDEAELPEHSLGVLLFGFISGTIHREQVLL